MYKFSKRSLSRLEKVHPDLVLCVHTAMDMQVMDFSVIEGVRNLGRQKKLLEEGKTRTLKSKHLIQSDGFGYAVDLYPYPINMVAVHEGNPKEIARFGVLAGLMFAAAHKHGIRIVSGMDWDGDGETLDHSFFDIPHYQLVKY